VNHVSTLVTFSNDIFDVLVKTCAVRNSDTHVATRSDNWEWNIANTKLVNRIVFTNTKHTTLAGRYTETIAIHLPTVLELIKPFAVP